MILNDFQYIYSRHPHIKALSDWYQSDESQIELSGLNGSLFSVLVATLFKQNLNASIPFLLIMEDADKAAYTYHDIKTLLADEEVFFFPSSYKKAIRLSQLDASNEVLRTEVLNRLANTDETCIVVTYPEALFQKVVSNYSMQTKMLKLQKGETISMDFLREMLLDYGFQYVDFVYEPGQFSIRGGIVDVFSYAYELPYRIDFFGDEIDSIRIFDIESQLSKEKLEKIEIIPNLHKDNTVDQISFFEFISKTTILSFADDIFIKDRLDQLFEEALSQYEEDDNAIEKLSQQRITGDDFIQQKVKFRQIYQKKNRKEDLKSKLQFNTSPQPIFHKNFDLVSDNLKQGMLDGYQVFIMSDSVKQTDRIQSIFEDRGDNIVFQAVKHTLHQGFIDHDMAFYCYTDHQIFDRFHKYRLRTDKTRQGKVIMTLKELNQFQIGDFVVHSDHGIGTFGGLVKTDINGTMQEMLKLYYRDGAMILVSIHSLHRISKYKGKEGEAPVVHKLGSGAWERLKDRTKSKVKDIARELIQLYAKRKNEEGLRFAPDSYLQHELEASFIYEDTPDQEKATSDVKKDMESTMPMDRLICGDVGFGKTEVAIRAAFKAATNGKQVAVLVPTTILALQHYHTFTDRLKDFPATVDYLSRARTTKETRELLQKLEEGEIDILIGTHKLIGKSVKFKDLGLLIVDEEQRFGVSVKEKLKQMKVNVDTLTMTATPIPRTLQFSLMGARDLSIINTPPPNRFPVQTEVHTFDEDLIREAIQIEMNRNGQVFFIHNRVHNIHQIESMIKRLIPGVRVAVGHGQMRPKDLEEVILDFIEYEYDVLVATTIIESGVDIPNVNTIIINSANRFGLSDLHQLRGRVGRSNRKAYCYLLAPDASLLTPEAKRRLDAIETFSELGSGFNIAMQDLDIRGAGNLLGAEQSGFIADLGYETYQRILNEAVSELKDEEFADLYADEKKQKPSNYVTECQIETDLELMFPASYIENVSERISLYRELDNMQDEEELLAFENRLEDRFGKIPEQSLELLLIVRLRQLAMQYGIEKLVLKNERMIAFLVSNPDSSYYQSDQFGKLLQFVARYHKHSQLRDRDNRRSIVIRNVRTVNQAYQIFSEINKYQL